MSHHQFNDYLLINHPPIANESYLPQPNQLLIQNHHGNIPNQKIQNSNNSQQYPNDVNPSKKLIFSSLENVNIDESVQQNEQEIYVELNANQNYQQHQNQQQNLNQTNFKEIGDTSRSKYLIGKQQEFLNTEVNGPNIEFNVENGELIEVVQLDYEIMSLNQIFLDLVSFKGNVGFVISIGDKGKGDKNLLNNILTVNAFGKQKHQNLYMWSKPVYDFESQIHIFFMEYFGDIHTENPFILLSLLLGSIILIPISELQQSLPIISAFVNIKKLFSQKINQVKHFFPKIFFIQSDHYNGNFINKKNYQCSNSQILADFLFDSGNQIKYKFDHIFTYKFLFGFRYQVQQDVSIIRRKILFHCSLKFYEESYFTNQMMSSFIQCIIGNLNNKEKLNLDIANFIAIENEIISNYNECLELFGSEVKKEFFDDNRLKNMEEIYQFVQNTRFIILDRFFQLKSYRSQASTQTFNKYLILLKQKLKEKEKNLEQLNLGLSLQKCNQNIQNIEKLVNSETNNDKFTIKDIETICQQNGVLVSNICLSLIGNKRLKSIRDIIVESLNEISLLFIEEISEIQKWSGTKQKELEKDLNQKKKDAEEWNLKHKVVNDELWKMKDYYSKFKEKTSDLEKLSNSKMKNDQVLHELGIKNQDLQRRLLESQKRRKKCY